MFTYNLNDKGLKKFEKDVNERFKESDSVCIMLQTKETKLAIDFTRKEIKELDVKVDVRLSGGKNWDFIDFDFKKIFLGSVCINDEVLKIMYDYDCYDSVEHYHLIELSESTIKFEYHNKLDELVVKENMED